MSEAYGKAVALLARREHSRSEIKGKLASRLGEAKASEIEEALDRLEKEGYLSDLRFAKELALYRMDKWGNAKIAHELRLRGIKKDTAAKVIAENLSDEGDRALVALSKKHPGPIPKDDQKPRLKLRRFLERRGFAQSSIRRAFEDHANKD